MQTKLPCVVYLHGNGCSRMEALPYVDFVCKNEMTLFCFDFSGSGQSQGPVSSIGWYEQEDLEIVVHYLYNSRKVSRIALWGRSMGGITSLLYARRDCRISCLIVDSAFSSFKQLVQELTKKTVNLPSFMAFAAFTALRNAILKKAGFDIEMLEPINHVEKMTIPVLFAAGELDDFVLPVHAKQLYELYKGTKQLEIFDGGHNSLRPLPFVMKALDFIKQHIAGVNDPLPENLQKDSPALRTEPLKQINLPTETKTEDKKQNRYSRKSQDMSIQKSVPTISPMLNAKINSKLDTDREVSPASRPKFQFSWLEHSSSSPSLHIIQKEEKKNAKTDEKKKPENPIGSEANLENPPKDSIAMENCPLTPNQTLEVKISAKPRSMNKNNDVTSRAPVKQATIFSPIMKKNPASNLPLSASNDKQKRKHIPIFDKKNTELPVLKIDLISPTDRSPVQEPLISRAEFNKTQQTERITKPIDKSDLPTTKDDTPLDSFRSRSYSTNVLIKSPYTSGVLKSYQKTATGSTADFSKNSTMELESTISTPNAFKTIIGLKNAYTPTKTTGTYSPYTKINATGGENSFQPGATSSPLKIQKSNTIGTQEGAKTHNPVYSADTQEPSTHTNAIAADTYTRRIESSSNVHKTVNYGQQKTIASLIKPYKLSEYSQKILQAKKTQNKSVDIVISSSPTVKRNLDFQNPTALLAQKI